MKPPTSKKLHNKNFTAQALKKPKEKICCAAFLTSQIVAPGEVES